jgi:hypothetical protein
MSVEPIVDTPSDGDGEPTFGERMGALLGISMWLICVLAIFYLWG